MNDEGYCTYCGAILNGADMRNHLCPGKYNEDNGVER